MSIQLRPCASSRPAHLLLTGLFVTFCFCRRVSLDVHNYGVPPACVVKFDQTGVHLIPLAGARTWAEKGSKGVRAPGLLDQDNKRQITGELLLRWQPDERALRPAEAWQQAVGSGCRCLHSVAAVMISIHSVLCCCNDSVLRLQLCHCPMLLERWAPCMQSSSRARLSAVYGTCNGLLKMNASRVGT